MRIETVDIKNLRCIKESVSQLDTYTCFVGPNGAGKSTVLCALNIFFRNLDSAPTDLTSLTSEDFYLQDTEKPIEVTVTFIDLSKEAEDDFQGYVRQGKLIVSAIAVFDKATGKAEVKQFGQRLGMEVHKPFFKRYGDSALAPELKSIFEQLEQADPNLAARKIKKTKDGMYEGLKEYEASQSEKCIPIESEDQFYGVSKGANKLAKYMQWIYIPAVKDASEEQSETKTSSLGKLLSRTVRAQVNFSKDLESLLTEARDKYQLILDSNQKALDGISLSLRNRLAEWAHPDATLRVVWEQDSLKAVRVDPPLAGILAGESGFEGKLARLGHGFQRSFLLALLQELASFGDKSAPTLILGCEEPELYQHPPQARHLAGVFEKLAKDGSQIIVTTHSPYFVSGDSFQSVRMVRRTFDDKCASIRKYSYDSLAARFAEVVGETFKKPSAAQAKLNQALQPSLNEMFFTQRLILVEGLEDVAYITSWLVLSDKWETYRRSGAHIVPVNGKSEMIRPAIVAQGFQIPTLAVFDADGDKIIKPEIRTRHHRDNLALLRLFGGDETVLFPIAPVWLEKLVVWPSDLGDTVEREFIVSLGSQGYEQFQSIKSKACADAGNAGDLEKNATYIGHLLSRLKAAGASSLSLEKLCEKVVSFDAPTIPVPIISLT